MLGRPRECFRDKPGFSPYFTQWKPSLSQDRPSMSLEQSRKRRAAEEVHVLKVYVPFLLATGDLRRNLVETVATLGFESQHPGKTVRSFIACTRAMMGDFDWEGLVEIGRVEAGSKRKS